MSNNDQFKVDIWDGDYGLISIDVDCLQLLTVLKFSGVEVTVNKRNNPLFSPNGRLPVFYSGNEKYTSFDDISRLLETQIMGRLTIPLELGDVVMLEKNVFLDSDLSAKQQAETLAYTALLREKLHPALLYSWWVDENNYNGIIRPWFCKSMPFPINFFYPGFYRRRAVSQIQALFSEDCDIESQSIQDEVYREACKCLTTLSERLGDSLFMFGSKPSKLDAVLYSYLAPILCIPLKKKTLQNHLTNCTNLRKYTNRISEQFYPSESAAYETRKKMKREEEEAQKPSEDFPNAGRNKIMAAVFVLTVMLGYAKFTGIVKCSGVTDDYDDFYPDDTK